MDWRKWVSWGGTGGGPSGRVSNWRGPSAAGGEARGRARRPCRQRTAGRVPQGQQGHLGVGGEAQVHRGKVMASENKQDERKSGQ